MDKKIYFLGANTADGYVSFAEAYELMHKNIFLLKYAPCQFKQDLFRQLEECFSENSIAYEKILTAGFAESADALFAPDIDFCIADASYPVLSDPPNTGRRIKIFNASEIFKIEELSKYGSEIAEIIKTINDEKAKMYMHLSEAKKIHDEWEKIYIENMDFSKAEILAQNIVDEIFGSKNLNKPSVNLNRFFGSMLPDGTANYINMLTEGFCKRIFIKGRPGTGKSTMLKKIRAAARDRGFDTETYYCSFDSKSLDMVVIRELGACVFDSTAPHEMFPEFESDSICDVYDFAVSPGTDEKYAAKLSEISGKYNLKIQAAKECLQSCEAQNMRLQQIYSENTDKAKSDILISHILKEFESL